MRRSSASDIPAKVFERGSADGPVGETAVASASGHSSTGDVACELAGATVADAASSPPISVALSRASASASGVPCGAVGSLCDDAAPDAVLLPDGLVASPAQSDALGCFSDADRERAGSGQSLTASSVGSDSASASGLDYSAKWSARRWSISVQPCPMNLQQLQGGKAHLASPVLSSDAHKVQFKCRGWVPKCVGLWLRPMSRREGLRLGLRRRQRLTSRAAGSQAEMPCGAMTYCSLACRRGWPQTRHGSSSRSDGSNRARPAGGRRPRRRGRRPRPVGRSCPP